MKRLLALIMVLGLLAAPAAPASGQESAAQREAAKNDAAAFAVYLSQLEAAGRFGEIYGLLHPDAQAFIPESAVVGWYRDNFAPKGPQQATVTFVLLVPWIYEVTGQAYFDAAAVTYVQPFADGTVATETAHFARDSRGNWRWFFGRTRAFVDSQIALYDVPMAPPPVSTSGSGPKSVATRPPVTSTKVASKSAPTRTPKATASAGTIPAEAVAAFRRVDAMWEQLEIGDWYHSPGMKGLDTPAQTGCGEVATDPGPFYCTADQTIYLTELTIDYFGTDDFVLGVVIAHEWGHHIQNLWGAQVTAMPDQVGEFYSIEMELTADCLAGVWAYSEHASGRATWDDMKNGLVVMASIADAAGSPLTDPTAHGDAGQRQTAFDIGYTNQDPNVCFQAYMGD